MIIFFNLNWVRAISQRLLFRPPVSNTHNHIKSHQIELELVWVAAVGHLLFHSQVAGRGVQGKKHQMAHRWDGVLGSLLNFKC